MQHQNIVFHDLLKQIPWAIFERLVEKHNADWDVRVVKTKAHLIAMLYGAVLRSAGPARNRNQPEKPRRQALSSWRLHGVAVGVVDG